MSSPRSRPHCSTNKQNHFPRHIFLAGFLPQHSHRTPFFLRRRRVLQVSPSLAMHSGQASQLHFRQPSIMSPAFLSKSSSHTSHLKRPLGLKHHSFMASPHGQFFLDLSCSLLLIVSEGHPPDRGRIEPAGFC